MMKFLVLSELSKLWLKSKILLTTNCKLVLNENCLI